MKPEVQSAGKGGMSVSDCVCGLVLTRQVRINMVKFAGEFIHCFIFKYCAALAGGGGRIEPETWYLQAQERVSA